MLSVDLNLTGGTIFGWPILPHGGGSYYNTFNNYIGRPPFSVSPALGERFGEYMPQDGEIFGAAINWAYKYVTGNTYEIFASNYGPSGFVQINPAQDITQATGGINTSLILPGASGSHSNWFGQPIRFAAGDYIGIYIYDTTTPAPTRGLAIPDPFVVEGTIYFRFNNDSQTGQNSTPNPWPP